ncbi:hypothetical protein I4F81_001799 [Pyropia yezoensis]|uniref:Uncharacterized protein n=1 Tax=Pyropia yezoensis TaxID=2788 RepID=A0ACC3BMS2_PYRYE|nr:hypothetical protein I4F81_001799 [Neopyropia yezoensis]
MSRTGAEGPGARGLSARTSESSPPPLAVLPPSPSDLGPSAWSAEPGASTVASARPLTPPLRLLAPPSRALSSPAVLLSLWTPRAPPSSPERTCAAAMRSTGSRTVSCVDTCDFLNASRARSNRMAPPNLIMRSSRCAALIPVDFSFRRVSAYRVRMFLIFLSTATASRVRASDWSTVGVALTKASSMAPPARRFMSPVRLARYAAQWVAAAVRMPTHSPGVKFLERLVLTAPPAALRLRPLPFCTGPRSASILLLWDGHEGRQQRRELGCEKGAAWKVARRG